MRYGSGRTAHYICSCRGNKYMTKGGKKAHDVIDVDEKERKGENELGRGKEIPYNAINAHYTTVRLMASLVVLYTAKYSASIQ